jgi:hypothetical protein
MAQDNFKTEVDCVLSEISDMLIQKNVAYGDAAMNPIRVFSRADPMEQLRVRIDDKLSRICRGHNAGEDVIKDLIGYLVIYRIQQQKLVKSGAVFNPT